MKWGEGQARREGVESVEESEEKWGKPFLRIKKPEYSLGKLRQKAALLHASTHLNLIRKRTCHCP